MLGGEESSWGLKDRLEGPDFAYGICLLAQGYREVEEKLRRH